MEEKLSKKELRTARAKKMMRVMDIILFTVKGLFPIYILYGLYLMMEYTKPELEKMYFGFFAWSSDFILLVVVSMFVAGLSTKKGESVFEDRYSRKYQNFKRRREDEKRRD